MGRGPGGGAASTADRTTTTCYTANVLRMCKGGADVQHRRLGRTGLTVSEIGFGGAPAGLANYLEPWDPASDASADQIVQTVRRALDLGVTYFDSAPGYGRGR